MYAQKLRRLAAAACGSVLQRRDPTVLVPAAVWLRVDSYPHFS